MTNGPLAYSFISAPSASTVSGASLPTGQVVGNDTLYGNEPSGPSSLKMTESAVVVMPEISVVSPAWYSSLPTMRM